MPKFPTYGRFEPLETNLAHQNSSAGVSATHQRISVSEHAASTFITCSYDKRHRAKVSAFSAFRRNFGRFGGLRKIEQLSSGLRALT
jgi:hypothetical protein